jgi:hypothetical protein
VIEEWVRRRCKRKGANAMNEVEGANAMNQMERTPLLCARSRLFQGINIIRTMNLQNAQGGRVLEGGRKSQRTRERE